jgi:hypothetical protein
MNRRDWLRTAGAAGLLFPFLRPRRAEAAPAPRLVLLMQSNGTNQPAFWPTQPGSLSSPILDPLLSNPELAARAILIKGLRNDVGGSGNGHDHGFVGLYSGFRSMGSYNDPWGSGISLDQTLKQKLTFSEPFPTLNCGVLATDTPVFKAHRRSFSYTAPRQQVPTEVDPYKLYAQFFGTGTGGDPGADPVASAKRRLLHKQTVLDYVAGDLRTLRSSPYLGTFDRQRLEAHETALREMERRLGATLLPDAGRPARCAAVRGPALGLDIAAEENVPALITAMFDFLALALSCGLTRIVTFQFGHGGEKWYFRWVGINENTHDDVAHRDDGNNPAAAEKVVRMNAWYATQVAYLANALVKLPEADGTVLDNTLVVWGNELATGPHGMENIPIVLLGRAAGRLERTGYLIDAGPQDYRRLGTSLLNVMGVPALGFGEATDCGLVQDLAIRMI